MMPRNEQLHVSMTFFVSYVRSFFFSFFFLLAFLFAHAMIVFFYYIKSISRECPS